MEIVLKMKSKENRLKTFEEFDYINAEYLANSGLYYSSLDKTVKCCSCEFTCDRINYNTDLVLMHSYRMTDCKEVKNYNIWKALDMSKKENRITSLNKWPVTFIDKEKIAACGFYYTGDGRDDSLQCSVCQKTFGDWQESDKPEDSHNEIYPNCITFEYYQQFNYTLIENRRKSFPPYFESSFVEQIVNSGFYYTGYKNGETISCFACHYSFTLKNNRSISDMDIIHKFYNKKCLYMLLKYVKFIPTSAKPRLESDLLDVKQRLKTLESWPVFFINKNVVANSGFFYDGSGYDDLIECSSCNFACKNFIIGDDPFSIHKHLNPKCYFVKNKHNINANYKPIYPNFGSLKCRIESFTDWPETQDENFYLMAEAGCVYSKIDDIVYCYYCNLRFSRLQAGDDIWNEHALLNSNCTFLLMTKGTEFIKAQLKKNINIDTKNSFKHLCKFCYQNPATTVCVNCGYSMACFRCADFIIKCPNCMVCAPHIVEFDSE